MNLKSIYVGISWNTSGGPTIIGPNFGKYYLFKISPKLSSIKIGFIIKSKKEIFSETKN